MLSISHVNFTEEPLSTLAVNDYNERVLYKDTNVREHVKRTCITLMCPYSTQSQALLAALRMLALVALLEELFPLGLYANMLKVT